MPKTITDIIPPSRRRSMGAQPSEEMPRVDVQEMDIGAPPTPPPHMDYGKPDVPRKKFPVAYVVAALVVVLAAIGVLIAFGGAKVEVSPIMREVTVSSTFSATPSSGDLPYEIITVELLAEREVDAEGEETVDLPAQGTVTIYNGQTKKQELIKNTRFESPDGFIFRIRDSVVIPAGTPEAPGKLSVTVYADAGGASYNIGPSTFTLPGLASSPAFDLVYAKSETPMSGGFSGTRPSIASGKRESEYESMKAVLKKDLEEKVAERVLDTHVLLQGATFFTYTPEPDSNGASDSVTLVEKGVATAYVFPKEALAKAIGYATLGVYTGQPVTLFSSENLTFTKNNEVPEAEAELLSFALSGNAKIVWVIRVEELTAAISGKSREAAKTILKGYTELADARLILKPFWASTLPEDPSKIKVEVMDPVLQER